MKIVKFTVTAAIPDNTPGMDADDIRDLLYDKDEDGCAFEVHEYEDEINDDNKNNRNR